MRRNLLEDTVSFLHECGVSETQVNWVGSRDGQFVIDWAAFAALADREYEDQTGRLEVAQDLVISGDYWWLERTRYPVSGCEGWRYCEKPLPDVITKPVSTIFAPPGMDADFFLYELNALPPEVEGDVVGGADGEGMMVGDAFSE